MNFKQWLNENGQPTISIQGKLPPLPQPNLNKMAQQVKSRVELLGVPSNGSMTSDLLSRALGQQFPIMLKNKVLVPAEGGNYEINPQLNAPQSAPHSVMPTALPNYKEDKWRLATMKWQNRWAENKEGI